MEQRDDYRGNYFLIQVSKNQTFVTKKILSKAMENNFPVLLSFLTNAVCLQVFSAAFDWRDRNDNDVNRFLGNWRRNLIHITKIIQMFACSAIPSDSSSLTNWAAEFYWT